MKTKLECKCLGCNKERILSYMGTWMSAHRVPINYDVFLCDTCIRVIHRHKSVGWHEDHKNKLLKRKYYWRRKWRKTLGVNRGVFHWFKSLLRR